MQQWGLNRMFLSLTCKHHCLSIYPSIYNSTMEVPVLAISKARCPEPFEHKRHQPAIISRITTALSIITGLQIMMRDDFLYSPIPRFFFLPFFIFALVFCNHRKNRNHGWFKYCKGISLCKHQQAQGVLWLRTTSSDLGVRATMWASGHVGFDHWYTQSQLDPRTSMKSVEKSAEENIQKYSLVWMLWTKSNVSSKYWNLSRRRRSREKSRFYKTWQEAQMSLAYWM